MKETKNVKDDEEVNLDRRELGMHLLGVLNNFGGENKEEALRSICFALTGKEEYDD